MKPFTHFYNEILMVLEASGCCVNPLLMVWILQDAAVKPFANFANEISMVLEGAVNT